MYQPARERPDHIRRGGIIEILCVIVVLIAMVALFAWFITHAGGGVLNDAIALTPLSR
jgi:hypothetical protein